jgi:hypothetical protein
MLRIHWDEKARRLAEKYDLFDYDLSFLELRLEQDNGINQMGIKTDDGRTIFWYIKDGWMYCDVKHSK